MASDGMRVHRLLSPVTSVSTDFWWHASSGSVTLDSCNENWLLEFIVCGGQLTYRNSVLLCIVQRKWTPQSLRSLSYFGAYDMKWIWRYCKCTCYNCVNWTCWTPQTCLKTCIVYVMKYWPWTYNSRWVKAMCFWIVARPSRQLLKCTEKLKSNCAISGAIVNSHKYSVFSAVQANNNNHFKGNCFYNGGFSWFIPW